MDKLFTSLDEIFGSSNQDLIQENANTEGRSPVGMISLSSSVVSKMYAETLLDKEVLKAYKDGYIYVHDFDYYPTKTLTCCQIDLGKLLREGFTIGDCAIRPAQSITTAASLACIIVQANQNMQHGGQSFPNFDFSLAPYVKKSYEKHMQEIQDSLSLVKANLIVNKKEIKEEAWRRTEKETFQAMEALVHNCNSMLSRNGCQVPFVSINLGLDTSTEGKMVSRNLMLAMQKGLGNGATPIFPIIVYKLKAGVSAEPDDPNYDLYQLALETTSKRLFPNFVNCDASYNINPDSDDPRDEIATMGCRTRVFSDVNGKTTPVGRGNLSFTTLNLPMIAQEAKLESEKVPYMALDTFYKNLDRYIDLCILQLKQRYEYQRTARAGNFKFLTQNGVWMGTENLKPDDEMGDALKHGSLSVGFIGLAEALKILIGKHHGESQEAWEIGYNVIRHIRKRMDDQSLADGLNWSVLATPAEGYAGKSVRIFQEKYGVIEGVSDKEYFTNSNHIPVGYKIKAIDKIKKEAPFHDLTNAGHILYVELDGDAAKNIKALDKIVQAMRKNNAGYFAINHPVDRCRDCGLQGVIEDTCPDCGSDDISRIRRITGYLVGSQERWNSGKAAEERDRVKHMKGE